MMGFPFKEAKMNNFFQSWAFWFLLGCFVVAVIAFILWVICAAGSKRSRAKEENEKERRQRYFSSKQMVSDVEDILGRKVR